MNPYDRVRIGDFVMLNSGGPAMKVVKLEIKAPDGLLIHCEWHNKDTGEKQHATFPAAMITVIPVKVESIGFAFPSSEQPTGDLE